MNLTGKCCFEICDAAVQEQSRKTEEAGISIVLLRTQAVVGFPPEICAGGDGSQRRIPVNPSQKTQFNISQV